MVVVTTILVPPGIGDIYWVLVKLRGFCRAHGIATPEIWIDAPDDKKRSAEFVERVPFVRFGSYHDASGMSPAEAAQPMAGWKRRKSRVNPVREEAYLCDGRHAFPDFEGFDWFLSFNGSINAGRSLDEIEPGWPTRSFATTGNGAQMPLDRHGYYGVDYDPAWRNKAGAAATKRTGKVLNDDRADWREAWTLFPGDVAYVWHGALHAAVVAESLEAAGFNVRSQIIWAKDRLVLSRGDYHWQHEPCWYAVKKTGKGHWAGDRKQTTLWQIAHRD